MTRLVNNIVKAMLRSIEWDKFKHRIILLFSYSVNRLVLMWRVKEAGRRHGRKRAVVVISQVVHMGDIVACEPIVRQVRSQQPDAFIVFAIHRNYRELADSHPEIDLVLPQTCIREWARISYLSIFDKVVDLNIYGRTCDICRKSWCKPDGSHGVTAATYYNCGNLLKAYATSADIPVPVDGPRVYLGGKEVSVVDAFNLPKQFVALHAGSNERDRELSPESWRCIVEHVNRRWGLPVVEIGMKSLVVDGGDSFNRTCAGQLSILQSAEVIRRSLLYLGSDSGPAHLANAVGAYGIIVLGHYHGFHHYMPYSGDYANGVRCELLYHEGPVSEMPVMHLVTAIARHLQGILKI